MSYSHAVRARSIAAAVLLMERAGCNVTSSQHGDRTTIYVTNKPDSADRHGEAYLAMKASTDVIDVDVVDDDGAPRGE